MSANVAFPDRIDRGSVDHAAFAYDCRLWNTNGLLLHQYSGNGWENGENTYIRCQWSYRIGCAIRGSSSHVTRVVCCGQSCQSHRLPYTRNKHAKLLFFCRSDCLIVP